MCPRKDASQQCESDLFCGFDFGFDSIILRKLGPKGRVSSRTYNASQGYSATFSEL
jgi:hypothetical protein